MNLAADEREALARFGLVTRTALSAFLAGYQSARLRGAGGEFAAFRRYEPFDDPRRIDWKVYGRTERAYLRQTEEDSAVFVRLFVDASESMNQPAMGRLAPPRRVAGGSLRMWDFAAQIAFVFALLAARQGDHVSCLPISDHPGTAREVRSLSRIAATLAATVPGGRWPDRLSLSSSVRSMRELCIVISDFCEHHNEITNQLRHWYGVSHELVLLHLHTSSEARHFGGLGRVVTLQEWETDRTLTLNADTAIEQLTAQHAARMHRLRTMFRQPYARYCALDPAQPLLNGFQELAANGIVS
jgi:uncharacterized protein (DUF58 family)